HAPIVVASPRGPQRQLKATHRYEFRSTPLLGEAVVVARRVAEAGVDTVRLLRRLLRELDAAALQLLVALVRVLGREEETAGRALRQQGPDLLPRLLVEDRWARNG